MKKTQYDTGATDKNAGKFPKVFRLAEDIDRADAETRAEQQRKCVEKGEKFCEQWRDVLNDLKPPLLSSLRCLDSWEFVPQHLADLLAAMERYIATLDSFAESVTEHKKLPQRAHKALQSFQEALENNFSYGRSMLQQDNSVSDMAMQNFQEALELQCRILAARADSSCVPSGKLITVQDTPSEAQDLLQETQGLGAEATQSLEQHPDGSGGAADDAREVKGNDTEELHGAEEPDSETKLKVRGGRAERQGQTGESKGDTEEPLLSQGHEVDPTVVTTKTPNHVPLVTGILISLLLNIGLFAWLAVIKSISFP